MQRGPLRKQVHSKRLAESGLSTYALVPVINETIVDPAHLGVLNRCLGDIPSLAANLPGRTRGDELTADDWCQQIGLEVGFEGFSASRAGSSTSAQTCHRRSAIRTRTRRLERRDIEEPNRVFRERSQHPVGH